MVNFFEGNLKSLVRERSSHLAGRPEVESARQGVSYRGFILCTRRHENFGLSKHVVKK